MRELRVGTEGYTWRKSEQAMTAGMVCIQTYRWKKNKKQQKVCLVCVWHHEGHLRSEWEEWWHTCTQRQGSLALVGRACARNANSHRHPPASNSPRLLCQQRQSSERLRTGLHTKDLVTHTETQLVTVKPTRVWHISSASLKVSDLDLIFVL